jgi:hypothetical protein
VNGVWRSRGPAASGALAPPRRRRPPGPANPLSASGRPARIRTRGVRGSIVDDDAGCTGLGPRGHGRISRRASNHRGAGHSRLRPAALHHDSNPPRWLSRSPATVPARPLAPCGPLHSDSPFGPRVENAARTAHRPAHFTSRPAWFGERLAPASAGAPYQDYAGGQPLVARRAARQRGRAPPGQ